MIRVLSRERWEAFDRAHPAPTFFARPAWALALERTLARVQAEPLEVTVAGERVVVPAVRVPGGPLHWSSLRAFPLGGYTCFLREDGTLVPSLQATHVTRAIARYADAAVLIPWPLAPAPTVRMGRAHETAVVDLRDGADAALGRVEGIFRRMAGQAERRGVDCAPCGDGSAVDRYYALLEASAARWGLERPPISKALIAALREFGGPDVEIWFARADDRDVAGGVVFYGATELFFWSAAMLAEYGRLRPSNALNVALIRAAAARGMSWYNLGSSEGLPGVARFKKEIGAQGVAYREIETTRTRYRVYARVRDAWQQRLEA